MKNKVRSIARFKSLFFIFVLITSVSNWQDLATAGTLKEIRQRKKLIVAVKDNLPLLGFRDRRGNLQGLEIDIARKLAAEIFGTGDAIELVPVSNQDRLKVVLARTVDLTIARVTITPNRSRVIDFSRAYYRDGTGIITNQPKITKNSDLVGKKIAILNNSSTIGTLQYIIPKARLVGVDSYQQAKDAISSGKVIAFAADRSLLAGWVQTDPSYHLLTDKLSTEILGIVIPKGIQSDPLHQLVDRSIERWQADGWLQQRIKYWGLPE
jgi:polar amino acid transport system substrate-binding protein